MNAFLRQTIVLAARFFTPRYITLLTDTIHNLKKTSKLWCSQNGWTIQIDDNYEQKYLTSSNVSYYTKSGNTRAMLAIIY